MKFSLLLAAILAAALPHAPAVAVQHSQAEAASAQRFSMTVEGSGPDVIMIPGLVSSRHVWDGAVAGLDGRYRVHRLQVAGFAGDPAGANAEGEILAPLVEELQAYIQRNGLQRPAIVGHSMGGLVALMLAQRHPQDVGRLLVVDALPFYGLLFSPNATADALRPHATAMREALLTMDEQVFAEQQAELIESFVQSDAARPPLLTSSLASDRRVAARAMFEVMTTDVRPTLGAITVPVTVAYATSARVPEAAASAVFRRAFAGLPKARFVEVPESYHFVMIDQPERFASILQEFLARD